MGKPKVGLFITCLIDLARPGIGFAAVKLLEQSGFQVEVPEQTCCGQPAHNSGDNDKTSILAKQMIVAFESYDYIVIPSGSCAATIKLHYSSILKDDADWLMRAQTIALKTFELTHFLSEVVDFQVTVEVDKIAYTYHDSCSGLRELGIQSQPRKFLRAVKGLQLYEMDDVDTCCGFGGLFCLKYPQISVAMAKRKVESIHRSGAELLIGGDLGCLLNLAGLISRLGLPIRVFHIAEILAYGLNGAAIGEIDGS